MNINALEDGRCNATIRQIMEKDLGYNRGACFGFIGLEKAFDKLELKTVQDVLERNIVPSGFMILIKNIHVQIILSESNVTVKYLEIYRYKKELCKAIP
jgi:hypothetical protein